VPTGYVWQLPLPSHLPFLPHDDGFSSTQTARGSALPAAMATQRPGVPGSAQLRQAPVQALSQQTPSTQ
jgi:hypothetical protein